MKDKTEKKVSYFFIVYVHNIVGGKTLTLKELEDLKRTGVRDTIDECFEEISKREEEIKEKGYITSCSIQKT